MAQSSVKNPAASTVDPYSDKDVALTRDWLTICGNSYSIADIKKVEVDQYYTWQSAVSLGCFVIGCYAFSAHHDTMVILLSTFKMKLFQLFGIGWLGFAVWGQLRPARMILHLSDRKVRVLQRDESNLKKLKTKIDSARKALKGADKAS